MGRTIRFYTDEHVPRAVVKGLRERGVDVLSVSEAGTLGASDPEHLARAQKQGRVLFTHDDDFLRLHATGASHSGIVYAPRQKPVGEIIHGLMLIYEVMDAREMVGQVEFLWRMMNEKENYLRTIEFRHPEWIPCRVNLLPLMWKKHRESLDEIVLAHPRIFPGYRKGGQNFDSMPPTYRRGEFLDNWGCLWRNECEGIAGQVVGHPLADWSALDSYRPPDPRLKSECQDRDWKRTKTAYEALRKQDRLRVGSGERLFDRLYFLRGFENLMMDIAADDPFLPKLIDLLLQHEMELVSLWLEVGVDVIGFHTDIGTQNGLMISPQKFRRYIKPLFKKLFRRCRNAGVHVALSSDGRLLEIVDDLVECGVSMHAPQVRANTLAGIEKAYKGKMCINLDLDRQMLPFCSPADIRAQVEEAVGRLNSPEGGFMVFAAVTDDNTPLQNIEAICQAFEEYCFGV